jgi:hypothetical protein
LPSNISSSTIRGHSSRYDVPGITPTIIGAVTTAVQDAYAYSFKFVYYCMLAFGLVAFACSFILLPNVDVDLTSLVAKKSAGI